MIKEITDEQLEKLTRRSLAEEVAEGRHTRDELADYLLTMCEIREFEDGLYNLYRAGQLKGATHMSAGQEAVPTGAVAAIRRTDLIASTHRGHGHCGAMGNLMAATDAERQAHWDAMMAELFGKTTGYCRGRGGSMHIADVEKGNLGATGIVAGNLPVATGAAMAEYLQDSGNVVLCFFGDGATNTGAFHESLNMGAALFDGLPVVYICENNLYGMSVPFFNSSVPDCSHRASKIEHIADRGSAYPMPGMLVDGQDVLAVKAAVREAVDRARNGGGPTLIECKTYRYYGHSLSDARAYRTREEERHWRERDPIDILGRRMTECGLFSQAEVDVIRARARTRIEASIRFALDSPLPDPSELHDNVFVDPVPAEVRRLIEAERSVASRVKPAETAFYRRFYESTGMDPRNPLPRLNKPDLDQLQAQHGIRFLPTVEALQEAHREEMRRDARVICMGEDIGIYGGAYGATRGLLQEFGPRRVVDTAISEAAVVGGACGAAMRGMRPIAEIMYIDFITISSNQLVHNIAYNRYQFGGKIKVPCVIRTEGGVGRSFAATHSESLESWFVHIPGLYVVMPSTPFDAKGLLKSAIRDDNPVLFIEHKEMYSKVQGPVPEEEYLIPLGVADVKRAGTDVTIVAYSRMVHFALAAAALLERDGIQAEVIDPRSLCPLDLDTIAGSVRKTGRLVMVQECYPRASMGESIIRQVMEYRFDTGRIGFTYLDGPPVLLAAAHTPVPMSTPLEEAAVPTVMGIVDACRRLR
jgi:pyruvate/2-oxoglutarate/acetoin dehydrogenase E1 component/TPP-dependent pyruvate/acetoin dehydrogenase alpha subunit